MKNDGSTKKKKLMINEYNISSLLLINYVDIYLILQTIKCKIAPLAVLILQVITIGKFMQFTIREKTCEFVQNQCVQDTVQLIQAYYCGLNDSFILLIAFGLPLFVLLYIILNTLTEEYLTPCVQSLISRFKISATLAGITFLAFANGAPDVLTAIVAGSSESENTVLIPFGSILGASLFSAAFILSAVIFQSPSQSLKVKKKQILTPLTFYITGLSFLMLVSIFYKKMNIYLALCLFLIYICFIIFVIRNQVRKRRQRKLQQHLLEDENDNSDNKQKQEENNIVNNLSPDTVELNDESKKQNKFMNVLQKVSKVFCFVLKYCIPPCRCEDWEPIRAISSLIISPAIIMLSQGVDTMVNTLILGVPLLVFVCLPSIFLLIHTVLCIALKYQPKDAVCYTLYSFLVTVAWLTNVCNIFINLLEVIQLLTGINPVLLGLTLVAWGNSIGDYLSITTFAKRGNAETAISGIFSGQLFNFLIGFGASLFIQSVDGQYSFELFDLTGSNFDILSDSIVMIVISAALAYFILIFITILRKNGNLQLLEGRISRIYYFSFVFVGLLLASIADLYSEVNCSFSFGNFF